MNHTGNSTVIGESEHDSDGRDLLNFPGNHAGSGKKDCDPRSCCPAGSDADRRAISPLSAGAAAPRNPEELGMNSKPSARWAISHKFDPRGAALADGHYSRRTVGSPQFMPPGQTLVLIADGAVFGWWRPHPNSGIRAMNGLDGWTCSIFRNTGPHLSSELILDAERALVASGHGCGPSGLLTYVWDSKVRSVNPGYCFKRAGWHVAGSRPCCEEMRPRSADRKKTLLHKEFAAAGVAAAHARLSRARALAPEAYTSSNTSPNERGDR